MADRPDMSEPPHPLFLSVPTHQLHNECYSAARAYQHGYSDGRWQSMRRRPGATRGRDPNYDHGFAAGVLDKLELDHGLAHLFHIDRYGYLDDPVADAVIDRPKEAP